MGALNGEKVYGDLTLNVENQRILENNFDLRNKKKKFEMK